MLVNYHCHSACSLDCNTPMADMARAARDAGITELCFTDHCDTPGLFSWEEETRAFALAREAVGDSLRLRLGVELGEATQHPDYARQILAHPGIDFVIGSVHSLPGGRDLYARRHTDRAQSLALLREYLDELIALATTDFYDVIGHITYPLRYIRVRDGVDVDFRDMGDQVDTLLRTVIEHGRGIEVNTSGYLTCGGEPMPPESILRRYRALGGEIVTIGSDAHVPARIAAGLEDGCALLRAVGFRYLATYSGRTPRFVSL